MNHSGASNVERCARVILAAGPAGWDRDTVLLHGCALLGVRPSRTREYVDITYLWVSASERGKGTATRVMRLAMRRADEFNVPLRTWAGPFDGGLPATKLTAWYVRLGFQPVRDRLIRPIRSQR